YRMSNIVAGIGRGQLEVLDLRVKQRRTNFEWYRQLLGNKPGITFLEAPTVDFFSNHWLTTITIDPILTGGVSREDLRLAFEKENIETRPLWKPMHMQPVFADCLNFTDGTSEKLFENGLCLPSGSNLTEEEKERIAAVLLKVFRLIS
ncbi:MAG TPA: pyridoxal phosphate-dependent aminotransferase, partial [Bacteroidales bacterium]|nr:pyridoxal phosphate-dependent aminotransferase [Bacteroidales bacterium]